MSNDKFRADFSKLVKLAGAQAQTYVRTAAEGIGARLVDGSPVDLGTFKNNWFPGIGAPNLDNSAPADKSGGGSTERIGVALKDWKPGQTIFITNNMIYARRLEMGWSKQRPLGIVRLAVQEFKLDIAEKINILEKAK